MNPTNCDACIKASLLPHYGEFYDGCISCEGRRMSLALPSIKRTAWQRAQAGDKHAQAVCSMAKQWSEKKGTK